MIAEHPQLKFIIKGLPLLRETSGQWAQVCCAAIPQFLQDHASCERKAHAAAMMMVNRHPDLPLLQNRMLRLAEEELVHLRQVVALLHERNLPFLPDEVDEYVKGLLQSARHPKQMHLLDRLMTVAVVEARSAERFCLFADALPAGDLKEFYVRFAIEEAAHFPFFIDTAKLFFTPQEIESSLNQFLEVDANLINSLPIRPTVH
jgi:tRNA 2-(methylsulfanyl)-N6-isopentenyladenosine37 hydroxylase